MTDFITFARVHGVDIPALRQGDQIFRCPTVTHPSSTNGAYYFDGRRGWVQNWETGEPVQWWNDDKVTPWSESEKREWAARRKSAEVAKAKSHQEAAKRASALMATTKRGEHPYLVEKGHPEAIGMVLPEGGLFIPMRDLSGALKGAQVIRLVDNAWEKKMIFGMQAKGAVFRIGPNRAAETYLVEGYSTGLSVDTALRLSRLDASVLVCFSASNLVHVAQVTAGKRFVFADNDASGTGLRAAQSSGLPYCMSDIEGEDANDLFKRAGVMAVVKKLMEARRS